MKTGVSITVNKDTGRAELTIPLPFHEDATFKATVKAFRNGKSYIGVCKEIKRKNL